MLKKRLIGVVTVKNGWAVQSFGYHRYLPLGKPECMVENLDRWGADEILVQSIDRSGAKAGPDYELLGKLARLGLSTPLIYGGGIRTVEEGVKVIQSGADRVVLDALLHDDLSVVKGLSEQLGAQAVIASIPVATGARGLEWFDYRSKVATPIGEALAGTIRQGIVSEVMLTDWQHEGMPSGFQNDLIDLFPNKNVPLITFGGISRVEQMTALLAPPNVAAIGIGNFLSYREHAVQRFKEALASAALRPPIYATEYPL
jgi:cyclase